MHNKRSHRTLLASLFVAVILILLPVIFSQSGTWTITNSGMIVSHEMFDDCDSIGGWQVSSDRLGSDIGNNTLQVDTLDKVQGAASLKMTWADTGSNWGGMFYRQPVGTMWNFSTFPVIRLDFKATDQLPANFRLGLACGTEDNIYAWKIYTYDVLSKVKALGSWESIDIDLRFPETYDQWPCLQYVQQIDFECWNMVVSTPATFRIDSIEKLVGPSIPLEAFITPKSSYLVENDTATFKVNVRGGKEPYSYDWYVDNVRQDGNLPTFSFLAGAKGNHTVKCAVSDMAGTSLTLTAPVVVTEGFPLTPPSSDTFKSEIRGVFIHTPWYRNPNWTLIAETCVNYGINTVVIETYTTHFWTNGSIVDFPALHDAITAFHAVGLKVTVLLCVNLTPDADMHMVNGQGQDVSYLCPTKNASRNMMKKIVESLAANYSIDGLMWDYIRYTSEDQCFCGECEAKFKADTGITNVVWPGDCLFGGKYYWNFTQWRMIPWTELARDMRMWALTYNPTLYFWGSVWSAFQDCGNYWCMHIGQHTADWVDKGYLDVVSPMIYTSTLTGTDSVDQETRNSRDFYVGGPEGKVPLVIFTTTGIDGDVRDISNFVEATRIMKNDGADGWIIWRYGGPGLEGATMVDIRPYLLALKEAGLMEPTWAIQNLNVSVNPGKTQATVSWTTTIPTKARIEYSNVLMFDGTVRYGDFGRPLYYKDVDYVVGTIQEDNTLKLQHSFTIPITNQTQFRIQSIDGNNTKVTSHPMPVP